MTRRAGPRFRKRTRACSDAAAAATGTDQLLLDIADYVIGYELEDPEALQIARYALLDSLGARAARLCASALRHADAAVALRAQAARCWR